MLSLHYYNNYCLIIPLFDYGDTVWGDKNNNTLIGQLQVLQNEAAKVLFNLSPRSSSTEALELLDPLLKGTSHFHRCVMIQKYLSGEIEFEFDIRHNNDFILIKLSKVMIYAFPVCVPIEASKLLFFTPLKTGAA